MALEFDAGAYAEKDTVLGLSAWPLTIACWANVPDITSRWFIMSITDASATNPLLFLEMMGDAGDTVQAFRRNTGGQSGAAITSTTYSADTWHHICGVYTNNTTLEVQLDAGGKGTNSTAVEFDANYDRTSLNRLGDSSPSTNNDAAKIDWPCVWDVTLTDAEIATLAAGAHPSMVRPQSIVGGPWDMYSTSSPVRDLWGDNSLTITGGVQKTPPPRIYYPSRPRVGVMAAVAATKSLPIFRYPHHNLVR